jgi:hypothetical protein
VDAGHILVAVLTTAAVGWLVWVEFHCRRNHVKQTTGETAEEGNLRHRLPETNSELGTMKALSLQKAKLGTRARGGRQEEREK